MILLTVAWTACRDELSNVTDKNTNPEKVPTMVSHDVQTVLSDSGTTRYRITTARWEMYEEAKKPHWIFPEGVIAEELNPNFDVVTSLRCDSAYFDERDRLWHLTGNVKITNINRDVINTDEMFWDQNLHEMYSDAFIHIEKSDRIIEGYGYRSNEQLTTYELRQVKAIFPVQGTGLPTAF